MSEKPVVINLELEAEEAEALAQFVKRVGWSEIRALAVDDEEGHRIQHAIYRLQTALAESGYAPR